MRIYLKLLAAIENIYKELMHIFKNYTKQSAQYKELNYYYWYSRHNDSLLDNDNNTYFGFPTRNSAPECEDLKYFEHDLYLLAKSIEFRKRNSHFQQKLYSDIKRIKS